MNNENLHHPFGPSSLERRELCPGSWRLEKDLPSVETKDSIEGTELHKSIADLISAFVIGKSDSDAVNPCSNDDLDVNLQKMFDFFLEVYKSAGEGAEVFVERRVSWKYLGKEQFFGSADVLIVCKEKVIVIDWKTGHRPVIEAADNPQGAAYALAAMQEFEKDVADVCFFNPVIGQRSSHTFNDKKGIERYIIRVISACNKEDAPLVTGESQCRYCKAAAHGVCPELAKTADLVAKEAEALVPLPSLSELSPEALCELKKKCDLIAKLGERVDNRIKAICAESGQCGIYTLKESSGGREIKDINSAFNLVKETMNPEEFLSCCSASVSKLEKLFAKNKKDSGSVKTEKEGKEEFANILSDLIEEKPKKKALVEVKR